MTVVLRNGSQLLLWIAVLLAIAMRTEVRAQYLAPRTTRDLLRLHGIDASQLERFQQGEPISGGDEETLIRMLQRFPRFPRNLLDQWAQPASEHWEGMVAQPAELQTNVYRVAGRAVNVERVPLLPEMASRLEFAEYYRVHLQVAPDQMAIVCTRNVPPTWLSVERLDEPAAAVGIFLKSAGSEESASRLVFAADRVAWYPTTASAELKITPSLVALAQFGFDVGLLGDLPPVNKRALGLADREAFYQLLAAIRRAERAEFLNQATQPLELVPLLRDPEQHHGQLLRLEGIARRAIRVRVEDPDIRERFGLDHYYQIDLFLDLDRQVIKLGKEDSEQAAVFENSFPVTVCVPSLPPDLPAGDSIREQVRVHAVFFKLWSYSSEFMSAVDKEMLQVSPMLIGVEPRVVPLQQFDPGIGYGLAALVTGLAVVGLWLTWRQRTTRATASRRSHGGDEDGGAPLPDRPDFTNL